MVLIDGHYLRIDDFFQEFGVDWEKVFDIDLRDSVVSRQEDCEIYIHNHSKGRFAYAKKGGEWLIVYKDIQHHKPSKKIHGNILTLYKTEEGHDLMRAVHAEGPPGSFHNAAMDYIAKLLNDQIYINSGEFAVEQFNAQMLEKRLGNGVEKKIEDMLQRN